MKSVHGKVYIHLAYGQDAEFHAQRYALGRECDASPYGFHLAKEFGWDVSFSEDAPESPLMTIIRTGIARCLGFDCLHAYRNRRRMFNCDALWTMTEYEWLAAAALQAAGVVPKRPIIGNSISVFNKWHRLSSLKKYLYKILANYCAILTVHSVACVPVAKAAFPKKDVRLMYFGIPLSTYPITKPVKPRHKNRQTILAIGFNRTRDWKTFLTAFGNDPVFDLVLICKWAPKKLETLYSNLKIKRSLVGTQFSESYASSDVVVIPMRRNIFAGITVLLEAVACGKPVVASRTGGCHTYFDEDEVTYVPCNDPAAMRNAATECEMLYERAIKAQAKFLTRDYSTSSMIACYSALTNEILVLKNEVIGQLARTEWDGGPQEQKLTVSRW